MRFDCIRFVTDFPDSIAKSQTISYMIDHEETIPVGSERFVSLSLNVTLDGFSSGDTVDGLPQLWDVCHAACGVLRGKQRCTNGGHISTSFQETKWTVM